MHVGHRLLAPNLFPFLAEVLHAENQGGAGGGLRNLPIGEVLGLGAVGGGFGGGPGVSVDLDDFVQIGSAIEALLWAFLGGWVACYFASGQEQAPRPARAAGAASVDSSERRGPEVAHTGGAGSPA
jgi:hypothetical protein